MRGDWGGVSAREYSCAHNVTWSQKNFGDLPPYLTYGVIRWIGLKVVPTDRSQFYSTDIPEATFYFKKRAPSCQKTTRSVIPFCSLKGLKLSLHQEDFICKHALVSL